MNVVERDGTLSLMCVAKCGRGKGALFIHPVVWEQGNTTVSGLII